MSALRLFGLALAIVIGLLAWSNRRSRRGSRGPALLAAFVAAGLALVSVFPAVSNPLAEVLGMEGFPGNRILILAVLAILVLFIVVLWLNLMVSAERDEMMNIADTVFDPAFRKLMRENEIESPDVLVVIPAYNEAQNLAILLPRIPSEVQGRSVRALVVSDGSTDGTAEVAHSHGALVFAKATNRGGGAALKTGYYAANLLGARFIVTMDADGQHRPEELETLLSPLFAGEADLVSGSRILGTEESNTMVRKVGIRVFARIISVLLRQRVTDPSNGYRAFTAKLIKAVHLREQQFHSSELIIAATSKGYRFREVPVNIVPRFSGETKKPRSLMYGYGFMRTIVRAYLRN